MTKRMKKLTAILLAGMLTMQGTTAMALDSIDADATVSLVSKDALFDLLDYVEPQKSLFGLDYVDFAELDIGHPILTYECLSSGLAECEPVYPLFYNGEVVASVETINGTQFQLSTGLADDLNTYLNNDVSIIYDSTSMYLYDGVEIMRIGDSLPATARISLTESAEENLTNNLRGDDTTNTVDLDFVSLTKLEQFTPLEYEPTSTYVNYYSCDVDLVEQATSEICWAASIACVCNYESPRFSLDSVTVARDAAEYEGENIAYYSQTRTFTEVESYLHNIYFTRSSDPLYEYHASMRLTDDLLADQLSSDHPIIAKFARSGSSVSHATVVCGFHVTSSYITIMDPLAGFVTAISNGTRYQYTYSGAVLESYDYISCEI